MAFEPRLQQFLSPQQAPAGGLPSVSAMMTSLGQQGAEGVTQEAQGSLLSLLQKRGLTGTATETGNLNLLAALNPELAGRVQARAGLAGREAGLDDWLRRRRLQALGLTAEGDLASRLARLGIDYTGDLARLQSQAAAQAEGDRISLEAKLRIQRFQRLREIEEAQRKLSRQRDAAGTRLSPGVISGFIGSPGISHVSQIGLNMTAPQQAQATAQQQPQPTDASSQLAQSLVQGIFDVATPFGFGA